jgi:hypothetical protein
VLLALFAVWVAVAWRPLDQQYAALESWRNRLGDRPEDERRALVDYPAYVVAQQVLSVTPPDACILFLAYTGPEHVNFYKTRFDYYLYPRRVLIHADTGAAAENCGYLAVFRDAPANLREEPFRGAWDEERLRQRLAGMQQVLAGPHVALYRRNP